MDAQAAPISVGTSATLVARGGTVVIHCDSAITYYGGTGVTTANGIPIAADTTFSIDLGPDEDFYMVAGSSVSVRLVRSTGYTP